MNHIHSTDEDHAIFRRMPIVTHARYAKADRLDGRIMQGHEMQRREWCPADRIERQSAMSR